MLRIHDHLVQHYGGMPGVRDEGSLESCLAQPKTAVFGVERFSTLEEKAAAYCFFVVRDHPFFDGNKRTGFVAALHFLLVNGVAPLFDEDEAYEIISRVATGQADMADVVRMMTEAAERTTQNHTDQTPGE